jgi:hypothetical protein
MDLSGANTGNGTKIQAYACNNSSAQRFHILSWSQDFWDGFDGSDVNWNNWSEQNIWVNQEDHCYVSGNPYGTRDVSGGSLKLRVKQLASTTYCSNWDKTGKHHPDTKYVASRIITKNKKKFVRGKWEARLKLWTSGQAHQFPAWWLLGDRNNEAPMIGPHDTCWCLPGSGEIDIFEHAGSSGANRYTMRAVKNKGGCDNGDWATYQISTYPDLSQYHTMGVELVGRDIYYLIDNNFIGQQALAWDYSEEMDAVLNYAKLGTGDMGGTGATWTMEVDYVQHKAASLQ